MPEQWSRPRSFDYNLVVMGWRANGSAPPPGRWPCPAIGSGGCVLEQRGKRALKRHYWLVLLFAIRML